MTVTVVGIIYSVNQNRIRRCIISDESDKHIYDHSLTLLRGEQFLTIPIKTFKTFKHPQHLEDHVASVLGSPPSNHRCIVVDNQDKVIAIVCADPIIDDHQDGILIQDDDAHVGHTYDFINQTIVKE